VDGTTGSSYFKVLTFVSNNRCNHFTSHRVCFLRLFYARLHPTICRSLVRHPTVVRSESGNRASVFPLSLSAAVTVSAFAEFHLRWRTRLAVSRKGEASSKRQGDGQRFQKKAMKTNNNQNREASAPANVRPSSVSKSRMPRLDFALRHRNRQLPTPKLLELLQSEAPLLCRMAQVVGQWVWIQFKEKQPNEVTSTLSQFGFHWNKRRQTWQHPCGVFCSRGASYDPRRRYGSRNLAA